MTHDAPYLRHIDPRRRMWRFYALALQPTLFGGVDVVRRWGRIGTRGGGQLRIERFADRDAAETALVKWTTRKRRRGYA